MTTTASEINRKPEDLINSRLPKIKDIQLRCVHRRSISHVKTGNLRPLGAISCLQSTRARASNLPNYEVPKRNPSFRKKRSGTVFATCLMSDLSPDFHIVRNHARWHVDQNQSIVENCRKIRLKPYDHLLFWGFWE